MATHPRGEDPNYGTQYQRRRARLLGRPCELMLVCAGAPATEADHVPPLSRHRHVEGSGCCRIRPACGPCQRRQAINLHHETRRGRAVVVDDLIDLTEPDGFAQADAIWNVAWLDDLRAVPDNATWPRLMTAPHPDAVGSLGVEFEAWCTQHRRVELRWWQRLVARRLLEIDADGRLVWRVLLLTLARQVGKSWLLWLLLSWRLHQGARFGTPQRLLHMSIQMAQVRDVMGREIDYVRQEPDYRTLDNNNETLIEYRDGSRWVRVVRGTARAGGAYGYSSVAVAVVDEAWSIPATVVDDGLEPTLVEGVQPQLLLITTAHRLSTALILDRRLAALDDLGTVAEPVLLVEWSMPRHYPLDDPEGWRIASPWWTPQREQMIRTRLQRALSGFASDDETEPDPLESVRAQWFNQHPLKLTTRHKTETLVDVERWATLDVASSEPRRLWVAVADNFGRGAGVVAVADIGDSRYELDAWTCTDREAGLADARATVDRLGVIGQVIVEPSLASIAPGTEAAAPADIRFGLPLLRELVESGRLVHDETPELDLQFAEVRVRPVQGGLALATPARSDLVRAAALAVRAAVVQHPTPAIH